MNENPERFSYSINVVSTITKGSKVHLMMLCHVHVRQIALLVLLILRKQEAEHGLRVVGRDDHRKLALVDVENVRPLEVKTLKRGVVVVRLQELLIIGRALALRICIIEVYNIEEELSVPH
jgi:hypothetical protein